jgi:hypothetical protein
LGVEDTMVLRRARGALLRLVWRRPVAVAAGALLLVPAGWLELSGHSGAWWVDGLILVFGATGAAIFWTGLTGARPDWIDEPSRSKIKT